MADVIIRKPCKKCDVNLNFFYAELIMREKIYLNCNIKTLNVCITYMKKLANDIKTLKL